MNKLFIHISASVLLFIVPNMSWALLGGLVDTPEGFNAVVALSLGTQAHCSATKISAHTFLTAAHCVTTTQTGSIDAQFAPGQRLFVSAQPKPQTRRDFLPLTVQKIQLHPAYQAALQRFFHYKETQINAYRQRYTGAELTQRIRVLEADNHFTARFPDLALVIVREATPTIPQFAVDCDPLTAGASVELVGYGFDSVAHFAQARRAAPFGQRHWGTTAVIRVDPVNFYTYGGLLRAGEPSLSPGDSGGPVLLRGRVVGVNGTVYGLSRRDAARSNMSVNLNGLAAPSRCHDFFRDLP
jgi:hypothetical protein